MPKTPDVETLIEMRDFHRQRAQEYDRALALLATAQKEAQRVRKLLGRVAARVTDELADGVVAIGTVARDAAGRELATTRRKRGRPRKHGRPTTAQAYSQRQRDAKKRGERMIDQARRVLADANGAPVTRETLQKRITFPPLTRAGQDMRIVGQVLARLAQQREVKLTTDGAVATARLAASVNGASPA